MSIEAMVKRQYSNLFSPIVALIWSSRKRMPNTIDFWIANSIPTKIIIIIIYTPIKIAQFSTFKKTVD
jgi:hypothetical protein